ncbi:MAG: cysteine synthase A [Actinobacteria bacterium]|nr:cysteine synthase A [Actinomycetota bacterium]
MTLNWERKSKIAKDLSETVGYTPLVRLNRITKDIDVEILGKIEYFNPSGSLKDRILFRMVEEAEKRGELKPGMSLIEATTGNTGIATSMVGAVKGYPVLIVMPAGMSEERKKTMEAYGAKLVYTPGGESDVDLTLKKVAEIKEKNPGKYWEVGQFSNPDNVKAHYLTTGPEIWEQTGGEFDIFVASQGTGGTISGVAKYIKEKNPDVIIFAVEPAECPLLSHQRWGIHKIEGIGDGFIPENLLLKYIDGVVTTTSEGSIEMAKRLAREEGIFCGISSGCNVVAAIKLAKKYPNVKRIVTMINDNGLRYFSTPLCGVGKEFEVEEREHLIDEEQLELLKKHPLIIVE